MKQVLQLWIGKNIMKNVFTYCKLNNLLNWGIIKQSLSKARFKKMRIKEIENMIYNTRNQEAQTQVDFMSLQNKKSMTT